MLKNLQQKFEQFTSSIGLVSGDGLGSADSNINDVILEQLGHPEDLSTWFSYRSFDATCQLFYNTGDNIGFILEIAPIVGVNEVILKNLQHFLDDELPDNTYLQFLLLASHKVGGILNEWESARVNTHPSLTKITQQRIKFISELALDFSKSTDRVARNIRIIVSCNWYGKSKEKILAYKQQLIKKLESLQLYPQVLGAQNLLDLVDEILHFRADINQRGNRYNPLTLLNEQIAIPGSSCRVEEQELKFADNIVSKCYRVAEFPKVPKSWGLIKMIELLGDSSRASLNVPARFLISYSIASNISKGQTSALIAKGEAAIKSAEQWYARYDNNLREEAKEWVDMVAQLKSGQRVSSESFQVMITAKKDIIQDAEASLLSLYNVNNWRLDLSKTLQLPSLISMLPMQASSLWSALKLFKMQRLGLSEELVAKMPIHAEWKGVPKSGVLLAARRGQLFQFNPFYRIVDGNYNVCVFGPSGSGKSVFLQEFVTSMLAQNTRVFILDIGGSYKNICHLLGGEYIQFKTDNNISLNPFGSLVELDILQNEKLPNGSLISKMVIGKYQVATDSIIYAKSILSSMCAVAGNQFKESIIEEAITKAIEIHGPNLNITKIAEVLENEGSIESKQMSKTLYPYTEKGVYGKYFERTANISFKKSITVFEFEEIKNDVGLFSVVIQILTMQIFLQVQCGNREQFVMVVDEAWATLDYYAKLCAVCARTFRKLNGSIVICVQNYSDLQATEDHQTILKNSTWSVILKQNEQGVNSFKGSNFEDIIPLIRSISMKPGKYAEMLLYSTGIRVVGKLVLDPYSQALFSTDAQDFTFIREQQKNGVSLDLTIEKLIEKKHAKQ